ncbi:hypothetical protein ColTof3_09753 [Colletotrichum tofieldiae]|nr:hypothetical protein ColTof3_09753 [Colletotrichum tofieldiae]
MVPCQLKAGVEHCAIDPENVHIAKLPARPINLETPRCWLPNDIAIAAYYSSMPARRYGFNIAPLKSEPILRHNMISMGKQNMGYRMTDRTRYGAPGHGDPINTVYFPSVAIKPAVAEKWEAGVVDVCFWGTFEKKGEYRAAMEGWSERAHQDAPPLGERGCMF